MIPGLERFPGGGFGNPLQYSSLENPMDRGAWWAAVHRVTRSQTQLKRLSARARAHTHTHTHTHTEELATTCIKAYALHRFSDGAHLSAVT